MEADCETPFLMEDNKFSKRSKKYNEIIEPSGFILRLIVFLLAVLLLIFYCLSKVEYENVFLHNKIDLIKIKQLKKCSGPNCSETECPIKGERAKKFRFEDFECYQFIEQNKTNTITLLEDVTESERMPRPDSIFFIETSCKKNSLIHLNPRQMCAIESAALTNSNRDVFVLFVTPVGRATNASMESKLLSVLQSYPNVFLRNLNMPKYVKNTPVEDWFYTGKLFTSIFIQVHASEFLRLLTIYKFGGTYFDLDFVFFKNLDGLDPNFICTELQEGRTGNGVINFSHKGPGHDYAKLFLLEFTERFNGKQYSKNGNGPLLFRRIVEQTCQTKDHKQFTRNQCGALEVLPFYYFYPIHLMKYHLIYENEYEWSIDLTKKSFGVRTWNSKAVEEKIKLAQPESPYNYWAKEFCPKMYKITKNYVFENY